MEARADSHFLAGKKIIVAGAGISGLAFAAALDKQWDDRFARPEVTIYDREKSDEAAQREGYSLSLNGFDKDGGLVALRDLGLLDRIVEHAILGLETQPSMKIWTSSWEENIAIKLRAYQGLPSASLRIARKDLRKILIDAATEHRAIRWETSCVGAERLEGERIRVQLSAGDGSGTWSEECDLLIAADGASSKIRAALRSKDTLQFAGAIQLGGCARFPGGIPAPVDKSWGLVITGEGVCCFFSPVDAERVVWAVSWRTGEPRDLDKTRPEEQFRSLMAEALERGAAIREPFRTIVEATEPGTELLIPARDKAPFRHGEGRVPPGVVFIGDSNHAVSPFAGNGANLGLKDGWDLARELCRGASLAGAVKAYDDRSVPRAVATIKSSHWRITMGHATGAAYWSFWVFMRVGNFMSWLFGRFM
ncbi:uncharacterized protein E0L32_004585 [Thyridium curvatum]|uniref:FAD-binding domain-containing protein n=1 Tax=Thyridium curvatum TaxID=1093900 RepID=A0A507BEV1_9PEZI|nr:uncharacterized protein E0L32_004585 [Thyridium curvatum]TPX15308.1 hypothetical protein E0L32_004585 [Thyridium curvatum]